MLTHIEVIERIKKARPGVKVISEFKNTKQSLTYICECGNESKASYESIIRSKKCRNCVKRKRIVVEYNNERFEFHSIYKFACEFEKIIYYPNESIRNWISMGEIHKLERHGVKIIEIER